MSLSIGQLSIGDGDTERALREALGELGVPAGEDWQVCVSPSSAAGAWEVVLQGPPRLKSEHIDWEIVHRADDTRYRKLFHKAEREPRFLKRALRKLLWESIQFRENPIWSVDPGLAEAFEKTVWHQLRHEEMKPVQVRFGVWHEGPDGMKFVCKVEYASNRRVPWSWWSGLVRTPQDLANELTRALAARRKRHVVSPSLTGLRRVRRAVPAPGPVPPPPTPAVANRLEA